MKCVKHQASAIIKKVTNARAYELVHIICTHVYVSKSEYKIQQRKLQGGK